MKLSKIKVLIIALILPAISFGKACSYAGYFQYVIAGNKSPAEHLGTHTEYFETNRRSPNACQDLVQKCQKEMREIFSDNTCKLRKIKNNTCSVDLIQTDFLNRSQVIFTYTKHLGNAPKSARKVACKKAKRKCQKTLEPFSGMGHVNVFCKKL